MYIMTVNARVLDQMYDSEDIIAKTKDMSYGDKVRFYIAVVNDVLKPYNATMPKADAWLKEKTISFDTEEDAIRIGNDIVFGLAAGVWTSDLGRAFRMSEKLKAGTVWVNTYRAVSFMTPFGGYKRSGQGRESGQESIKEFMQVKSVWIAQQTTSSNPFIMQ